MKIFCSVNNVYFVKNTNIISKKFFCQLSFPTNEQPYSNVKTKTNSCFPVKVTERSNHLFLLFYLMNHVFQTFVDNRIKRT